MLCLEEKEMARISPRLLIVHLRKQLILQEAGGMAQRVGAGSGRCRGPGFDSGRCMTTPPPKHRWGDPSGL